MAFPQNGKDDLAKFGIFRPFSRSHHMSTATATLGQTTPCGDVEDAVTPNPCVNPRITFADLDQRGQYKQPSRGGRPSLYTVPTVLTIIAALFGGASRAEAARRAGVGVSTFYVWLQLGRAGHPTYQPLAEAIEKVEVAGTLTRAFVAYFRRRGF